ncbi:MAG TPA: bifunctional phosphopantothenoylcysteine decarboxylase/phosphopantothenate--cysteine ligase CoaBC [Gemmatimonadaceae bacterium]|nr:bifunctional phosphopantothenoylcysteine decarboxylase/phosphopantothenate--cysteine ligase CoaBC [Gemmatimonadaceae bacterium]
MRPFEGRRVLLGVTGGIASYKAGWLARLLAQGGAAVDVVMTGAATEFVGPITFEALTGRPVHTDIFALGRALDHIRLAREADAVVVAPATADFMARAAQGRADDLLTACLLATEAPVLLVPAMNDRMWAHPQTRRNVEHLRGIGYTVVEPDEGPLAAGEGSGPGRMPEPDAILAHAARLLDDGSLAGRRVVVTAGPTREAIDPVRFLSNRSSGKMGVALAAAAWRRGADVTLIAGPLEVPLPVVAHVVRVETTEEMAAAVRRALPEADALIMAAAPADFRAALPAPSKIKKQDGAPPAIQLTRTTDILADTRDARRAGAVIVGFALETDDLVSNAREKLAAKQLDLIVANDAREPGAGFAVDTNRVTLIARDGEPEVFPLMPKSDVADLILDRVGALLGAR